MPEYCRATLDRRLLTGDKESVLAPVKELIARLEKKILSFRQRLPFLLEKRNAIRTRKFRVTAFSLGWYYDPKEDYIQKILGKVREAGYDPKLTQYSFCTNGSHYAGEKGISHHWTWPFQGRTGSYGG